MTEPRVYGHTRSGRPITDAEIETLAAEAEAGYDVDEIIARRGERGRPALSSAPASIGSVRLDPESAGHRPRLDVVAETPAVAAGHLRPTSCSFGERRSIDLGAQVVQPQT